MNGTKVTSPLPPAREIETVESILSSNHLTVRDIRLHTRGMIAAVQPLCIDGKEIFTDTILAQHIVFADAEQMSRETETLALKKSTFGDFEPSMTPIPKYCFRNTAASACVLVHSVPRFTLEDILDACVRDYPQPYAIDRVRFYTDWIGTIRSRLKQPIPSGKARLIRYLARMPKLVFPQPPHISQAERKTFIARILQQVRQHHDKAVFHDCICEKTIFFPTPYQPLLLSNYTGIPSSLLADIIPDELTEDTTGKYGPHFRDVYTLALIGYRILTGERHDGTRFLIDSPRPTRVVLHEIARHNGLPSPCKDPVSALYTLIALIKTIQAIAQQVPPLFSPHTFSTWRKINRATGGVWRSIPLLGPFCDIFAPTKIAQALRFILDRHWLSNYGIRTSSHSVAPPSPGPDLAMLTTAFATRSSSQCTVFETALNRLISEHDAKRKAFGSMMEFSSPQEHRSFLYVLRHFPPWIAAVAAITAGLLLAYSYRHHKISGSSPAQEPASGRAYGKEPSFSDKEVKSAETTTSAVEPDTNRIVFDSTVKASPATTHNDSPKTPDITDVNVGKQLHPAAESAQRNPSLPLESLRKTNIRKPSGTVVNRRKPKKTTAQVLPPKGTLNPAFGFQNVFIVTGVKDSCNPGMLAYPATNATTTLLVYQLPVPPKLLFLVHRSANGFDPVKTIRFCTAVGCDTTLYYHTTDKIKIGKPAFVRSGDAIGSNREELQRFVRSRLSLGKK